jgi:hypothetical protein
MILSLSFRERLVWKARSEVTSSFSWLAPAIRGAQLLGLHRLGPDPHRMPADDPAWPPGRNTHKREIAKRIWFYVRAGICSALARRLTPAQLVAYGARRPRLTDERD